MAIVTYANGLLGFDRSVMQAIKASISLMDSHMPTVATSSSLGICARWSIVNSSWSLWPL